MGLFTSAFLVLCPPRHLDETTWRPADTGLRVKCHFAVAMAPVDKSVSDLSQDSAVLLPGECSSVLNGSL